MQETIQTILLHLSVLADFCTYVLYITYRRPIPLIADIQYISFRVHIQYPG